MSYGMNNTTGNQKFDPTGKWAGDKRPSGTKIAQLQQFTPQQLQQHEGLFQHVGPESYLSRLAGGDQSLYGEIEAPALRQFSELQGGLASRFSAGGGRGSLGNRRSSGFQNTQTAAASNFAQELQAQRLGLQRQATRDLFELSNQLLGQRPYERSFVEKPQKQGINWGGIGGAALGGIGGFFTGGPGGALAGASSGYNLGSGFTGQGGGSGSSFGNLGNLGGFMPQNLIGPSTGYNAAPGLENQFRSGEFGFGGGLI